MDTRIDPTTPPLSADELAQDATSSPHGLDQPPLTEAQEGKDGDHVDNDSSGHGDQARAVDTALTKLPPG